MLMVDCCTENKLSLLRLYNVNDWINIVYQVHDTGQFHEGACSYVMIHI